MEIVIVVERKEWESFYKKLWKAYNKKISVRVIRMADSAHFNFTVKMITNMD
jgi:hypothetical protein